MPWESAFGTLLDDCLELKRGDEELVVVYDESSSHYVDALQRAALARALTPTLLFVPEEEQVALVQRASVEDNLELPGPLRGALAQATAILSIPTSNMRTVAFRRTLVQYTRSGDCRLAHIPGLNDEILQTLARSPFKEVQEACELVAWALGEAHEATILTYDDAGEEHELSVRLTGWDDEPMMSSGVIAPGSWGNVPPGEAFCCPEPEGVNGTIVIDGSVPGARLGPGQGVHLHFLQGVLDRWENAASPAYDFLNNERNAARARADSNWRMFAELGFGLNPAITELTGNALFDEKAGGTVHVAIGDNTPFGYRIRAGVHADMVTRQPTVVFNRDFVVVERGVLQLEALRRVRDAYVPNAARVPQGAQVFLRDAKVVCENGVFKRRLFRNQRVGHVRIGSEELSCALAGLVEQIREMGEFDPADLAANWPSIGGYDTRELVDVLFHYRAVGLASI